MKKVISCSFPMTDHHWRFDGLFPEKEVTRDGVTKKQKYMTLKHAFTHIDAPCHINPTGGKRLNDLDIYSFLIGKASIMDVSYVTPCQPINAEMLKKAHEGCETDTFLLVKTSWDTQRDVYSHEYWLDAPYLTPDAAEYLKSLGPKVVGFDFPQDYGVRESPIMTLENAPTHFVLLPNDICQIEYMCNLYQVTEQNVEIFAVPLNLDVEGLDFAPINVIIRY